MFEHHNLLPKIIFAKLFWGPGMGNLIFSSPKTARTQAFLTRFYRPQKVSETLGYWNKLAFLKNVKGTVLFLILR